MADRVPAALCSSLCFLQDSAKQRQIHRDAMEEERGAGGGMFPELPLAQSSDGSTEALLGSVPSASGEWGVCKCPTAKDSGDAPARPRGERRLSRFCLLPGLRVLVTPVGTFRSGQGFLVLVPAKWEQNGSVWRVLEAIGVKGRG